MIYKIILLVLMVLTVGLTLGKHGEPKTGKYNLWVTLFSFLLEIYLLHGAGFFNNFNI